MAEKRRARLGSKSETDLTIIKKIKSSHEVKIFISYLK